MEQKRSLKVPTTPIEENEKLIATLSGMIAALQAKRESKRQMCSQEVEAALGASEELYQEHRELQLRVSSLRDKLDAVEDIFRKQRVQLAFNFVQQSSNIDVFITPGEMMLQQGVELLQADDCAVTANNIPAPAPPLRRQPRQETESNSVMAEHQRRADAMERLRKRHGDAARALLKDNLKKS
jgi:hypothetical protein